MDSSVLPVGIVALLAGMISFVSPCVFPIVPAYLSLISGLSFEELQEASSVRAARWRLLGSALAFVFGFGLVTVLLLGSFANLVNIMSPTWRDAFRWVGGVIILLFALHMIGIFRINLLLQERRFHLNGRKFGILGIVLIGAAFGFGWSPCIGPFLSGVFMMAANASSHASIWWIFIIYTLGLAVPFLLAAVFVNLFLGSMRKVTRYMRTIEIASGVLLLAMGVLLVTNQLSFLSGNSEFLMKLSMKLEGMLQ